MRGVILGEPIKLLKSVLNAKSEQFNYRVHVLNFKQALGVHAGE